jgi:anti-sigma B factor antagonist
VRSPSSRPAHLSLVGRRATANPPPAPVSKPTGWPRLLISTALHEPATTVIGLEGEIDLATAPHLRTVLTSWLDPPGGTLIIDLSRVQFLGGAGLSVLLHAQRHSLVHHWQLRLVTGPRCVERPLAVTGLRERFACHPGLPDALAAVVTQTTDAAAPTYCTPPRSEPG